MGTDENYGLRGLKITISDSRRIKAAECPPHFIQFLHELLEMAGFTSVKAEMKNAEISNFAAGNLALHLGEILNYIDRSLFVIQKRGIDGVQDWLQLLQTGGVAAIESDIDNAIREGRAPADMFFDLAAWESEVEDSDYGRLLNIQDLPTSTRAFFENLIDPSKYEIDPDLEGQPDYALFLFLEGLTYFEPSEITSQVSRVFKGFTL